MDNKVEIIETGEGLVNIKNQCPNCGSYQLKYNEKLGKIFCSFCNNTFEPKEIEGIETDLKELTTQRIGSGALDINPEFNNIMTFKCPSCGAEVFFDTKSSTQTKCHWCHSILTINERIPNGAVPDVILPFKITKEEAMEEINKFVDNKRFFARSDFKNNFTAENTVGVYLPYLLVDVNAHCKLTGEGEKYLQTNQVDDVSANAYRIEREFNITIDDLSIESNSNILDKNTNNTNNIINSIMPFDTENCVKFESNYLVGYSCEKRDVNISNLKEKADKQVKDIIRASMKSSINQYDRGVSWKKQDINIFGSQWIAAYLPVWLYSFQQKDGTIHYIAVNARTKETHGSIPPDNFKLNLWTIVIVSVLFILLFILPEENKEDSINIVSGVCIAVICANIFIKQSYRSKSLRHNYEKETKYNVTDLVSNDTFIGRRNGLSSSYIAYRNDNKAFGA